MGRGLRGTRWHQGPAGAGAAAAGGASRLLGGARWPGLPPRSSFGSKRGDLSTFFPNTPFLSPRIASQCPWTISLRRGPGRAQGRGGAPSPLLQAPALPATILACSAGHPTERPQSWICLGGHQPGSPGRPPLSRPHGRPQLGPSQPSPAGQGRGPLGCWAPGGQPRLPMCRPGQGTSGAHCLGVRTGGSLGVRNPHRSPGPRPSVRPAAGQRWASLGVPVHSHWPPARPAQYGPSGR